MNASEIKNRTVYMMCRTDKPDDGTDIYVGSTSQPLCKRLCEHRYSAKNFIERGYSDNNKLFSRMNEVGLYNFIPLVTFACDKNTIREFECSWVQTVGADLTTFSPITDNGYANWRRKNKHNKRYFCEVCGLACGTNLDLKNHLNTCKHFMKWVWSID